MEKKLGTLYIIPTPIGNLEDITLRSINTLKDVDLIFCEDTRETGSLLKYLDIKKRLIANHNYNEKDNIDKLIKYLKDGMNIGLVSDRGTPIISDPGWKLIKEVVENNLNVISLPGATALIPALTVSGLDATSFLFYGFLSNKEEERKKELQKLKDITYTLIFYEAPHRVKETLLNMLEILGDRSINISREISKIYEEHIRGKISDIINNENEIKGEIVIVVSGNKEVKEYSKKDIIDYIDYNINNGLSPNEAIKQVSKDLNISKNNVYKMYHNLD